MADTTTIISRKKLEFPDIGYSGGVPLEVLVKDMFTVLGDNVGTRYEAYSSIANSTTVELDHNFGAAFAEYKILLYTGTATDMTRVQDPAAAGWTIAAKAGSLKTVIEITTPGSGGPHSFFVIMSHGTFIESIDELDDVNNTGVADGYILKWVDANSRYEPGANTVTPWTTSFKTALYTAVDKDEIFANTGGGAFQINLPAAATIGKRVRVIDYNNTFGSNTLTVGRNGNNINGAASDMTLSTNGIAVEFVANGNGDWRTI